MSELFRDFLLVAEFKIETDIVGGFVPDGRHSRLGRIRRRGNTRKRLVIDRYKFAGVLGGGITFCDDRYHRLTDMTNAVDRKRTIRRLEIGPAVPALALHAAGKRTEPIGNHILAGEHGQHPGMCFGPG